MLMFMKPALRLLCGACEHGDCKRCTTANCTCTVGDHPRRP